MPKVSVIVPTCNRPHLIRRTIDSILKQTFQDFEIIVVDDGMKERAEEVVKSFGDSRIRYIHHETNKGGGAARNTGIKVAQGEYIAFLDDDDEWSPDKLERQIKAMDKSGDDVGFCFTAITQILDNEERSTNIEDGVIDYYEKSLTTFKRVLTSALLVKKEVFERVGYFDEKLPSHQEAELIIRISKEFKAIGINKPMVKMISDSGHESIGKSLTRRIKGEEMLLEMHIEEYKKRPHVLAKHYFQIGLWYRDSGDYKEARRYFLRAWVLNKRKTRFLLHYMNVIVKNFKKYLFTKSIFKPVHFGVWLRDKYFDYYLVKYIQRDVKNIFDAGCGKGKFSEKLARIFPEAKVYGQDIKRQPEWDNYKSKNMKLSEGDLSEMADREVYDLIASIDVLEHIKNNKEILKNFFTALKKDGYLYLAMPCSKNEKNIFPKKYFKKFAEWDAIEHIGEQYDLNELEEILKGFGFNILFSRYTFTFFGRLGWELEFIIREASWGGRLNIILMPFYKMLGRFDIFLPIGKGNVLVIADKK